MSGINAVNNGKSGEFLQGIQTTIKEKLNNAIEAALVGIGSKEVLESSLEEIDSPEISTIEIEEAIEGNNDNSSGYGFSEYESIK